MRTCSDCGVGISHRGHTAFRCERCQKERIKIAAREHSLNWWKRNKQIKCSRICGMCAIDITYRGGQVKYCESCAAERINERNRRYEHSEEGKKIRKIYEEYRRPIKKIYDARPEKRNALKQYRKTERGKAMMKKYVKKRKEWVNQAGGNHTDEELRILKIREKCCIFCGVSDNLTTDHFIPFSRGGNDYIKNIHIACNSCNASKQDKLPEEWFKIYPEKEKYFNEQIKKIYGENYENRSDI